MQQRNFGLDVVRSIAIIMPIISHAKFFFLPHVTNKAPLLALSVFGLYGVELFFALSGFLIGQILLREVAPNPTPTNISRFYLRRWLRTLPAYYLVLTVLLLTTHQFTTDSSWHWRHFFFLQNFSMQELDFFGVSWSLSVEEWFYLITPLVLYLCAHTSTPRHSLTRLPWILLFSIIFIASLRYGYVLEFQPSWDAGIRKCVPLRFDSLFLGIGVAWIRRCRPPLYQQLASKTVFSLSMVGLAAIGLYFAALFPTPQLLDTSIFARTWSFTLTSALMALCLPFCEQNPFINKKLPQFWPCRLFFTHTSLYAYMIYLIHLDIFIILFPFSSSLLAGIFFMFLGVCLVYLLAAMAYHWYEKPIMNFRDRIS